MLNEAEVRLIKAGLEDAAHSQWKALTLNGVNMLALCDALLEAWERARGCPCLWTTPCKPNCSCATPILSAGCSRCARYGSDDQRRTTAVHIAAAQERERAMRGLLRMMTTGVHRVKHCWCTPVPSEESDEHQAKCIVAGLAPKAYHFGAIALSAPEVKAGERPSS